MSPPPATEVAPFLVAFIISSNLLLFSFASSSNLLIFNCNSSNDNFLLMLSSSIDVNGINIFNPILEICTADSNFYKIKKIEEEIINDGFEIKFNEKNIKISTIFFDNIKTSIYIYIF